VGLFVGWIVSTVCSQRAKLYKLIRETCGMVRVGHLGDALVILGTAMSHLRPRGRACVCVRVCARASAREASVCAHARRACVRVILVGI